MGGTYYISHEAQSRRNEYWPWPSVCLSLAAFPHYCTDPDVTCGNGRGCPLVVHYWAELQLVHGFHCYDNIAPNAKCQRVLVLALWLVKLSDIALDLISAVVLCHVHRH